MTPDNPNKNKVSQRLTGVNATGIPYNIFYEQREENGLSPEERTQDVDMLKTTISTLSTNPKFDIVETVFNVDNINGIKNEDGTNQGLRWKMNPDNEYYKKLYPNITDEYINSIREVYHHWQDAYNGGYIQELSRKNLYQIAQGGDKMALILAWQGVKNMSGQVKITHGLMSPETSAFANYYHLDPNGEWQYGRPTTTISFPDGTNRTVFAQTKIVPHPDRPNEYVFQQLNPNQKEATDRLTNVPLGSGKYNFVVGKNVLNDIVKNGGKRIEYINEKGNKETVLSVVIDKDGRFVTTNKYLGGQSNYNAVDVQNGNKINQILKERNFTTASEVYTKDNEIITGYAGHGIVTDHQRPTYSYKESYGFWNTLTNAFSHTLGNTVTLGQNLWALASPSYDAKASAAYYESLLHEYQSPIAINTSSPYYHMNLGKMIGENLMQIVPSILLAPFTFGGSLGVGIGTTAAKVGAETAAKAGVKAGIKAGIKKAATKTATNIISLGKHGAEVVVKKNVTKAVVHKSIMKTLSSASFWGIGGAQQGWGTYREGIQSGVLDRDAALFSIYAMVVTSATSKMLEPVWLRDKFYVGLNKSITSKVLGNMASKAGIQSLTKEGKHKFANLLSRNFEKVLQMGGVGGFTLRTLTGAGLEGAQETLEQIGVGAGQWFYNKVGGGRGKAIGEGAYDVAESFSDLSTEFVLGAGMGFMWNINPVTIVGSIARTNAKKAKTDDYTLYNQFNVVGTERVVKEAQATILKNHKDGKMGSANKDVNGDDLEIVFGNETNPDGSRVVQERKGATIDIKGQPLEAFFEGGLLRTENDMNAYMMLTEVAREADLFNEAKNNFLLENISGDELTRFDVRNNIIVNAAVAYKELQTVKDNVKKLEEQLQAATTDAERNTIQTELDKILTDNIYDDETLSAAQYKYDVWAKPLESYKTDELGKVSLYKYSKGIREAIINNMITLENASIFRVMTDEKLWKELDTAQKNSLVEQLQAFKNISMFQAIFGDLDYSAYKNTTKKSILFGLADIINKYNNGDIKNKYTAEKMGSIDTMLKQISDLAVSDFDIKTRGSVHKQISDLMVQLRGLIGDTKGFAEAMALYNVDDTKSLVQSVNASIDNILSMKNKTYEQVSLEELEEAGLDIDTIGAEQSAEETLNEDLDSYFNKEMMPMIAEQEATRRNKVDVNTVEGEEKQEDGAVLDDIANRGIEMMTNDMPLAMLAKSGDRVPLQFKHFTIGDMLRFVEDNKDATLDVGTMNDISVVIDMLENYYSGAMQYISTLETLNEKAATNELYEVHTYNNNVTKRYLKNKDAIINKFQMAFDAMKTMEANMRKNGFSRSRDDVRYLSATVLNTDTYINTIGRDDYVAILSKLFILKSNGDYDVNTKAKGIEGIIAKRLVSYLEDRNIPKERWSDVFKEMHENIEYVDSVNDEYSIALKKMIEDYFGTPPASDDSTLENIYTINTVAIELERAYSSGEEGMDKRIAELEDLLNNIHALQWEMRNKLSGKLALHLIATDAIGEDNQTTYQFMQEHNGRKLYADRNNTTAEDSAIYRGTYSPADIMLGKTYLFEELVKIDDLTKEELEEYADKYDVYIHDKMTEEEMRDVVKSAMDTNYMIRKHSAFHLLMTNLTIDNYLGGSNMTVSDIYNSIDSFKEARLVNNSLFSETEREDVKRLIVYENDKIDIGRSIAALTDYIANNKSVDTLLLAQSMFRDIRMNVNVEQEQMLLHMIASFYKNEAGDFGLGMSLNEHKILTPHNNSICVLGGGGTGKSTMIMENYYNIIRTIIQQSGKGEMNSKIIPANGKLRILTLSPTHRITQQQNDIINNVFAADEVELASNTFHNVATVSGEYDLVVVDEASLIDQSELNPSIMKMLANVKAKQVVFIYDNNQTINATQEETNITNTIGERTIPLEMRYRTGFTDMNTLSNFFTGTAFLNHANKGDKQMPSMSSSAYKIKTRYKKTNVAMNNVKMELLEGIRITSDEANVIEDYKSVKKYSSDVAIVVRTKTEKDRVVAKYGVDANDVYILEYGDVDYNVSGMSAENVFVIIDNDNVLKEAESNDDFEFNYNKLSKWYNTAITRLRGNGYLSLAYPNSEGNSIEINSDDVIPKYNDVLNIDNAQSEADVISIFEKQATIELGITNDVLDRHNKVRERVEAKFKDTIKDTEANETNEISEANIAITEQHIVEDISKVAAKAITQLRNETLAAKDIQPITNVIYSAVSETEDNKIERSVNSLLRYALTKIYDDVLKGMYPVSFVEDMNMSNKIYSDLIDEYVKYLDNASKDIQDWIKEMDRTELYSLIHNMVINAFSTTGIELLASVNTNTAIVGATITGEVSGETYGANPLFVNAVGYTIEKGKKVPIFDIYMIDISRQKRSDSNPVPAGTMQHGMYAAAMLAAKGYKVNKVHMLNYTKNNVAVGNNVRIRMNYEGDTVFTKQDFVANSDFNKINNIVNKNAEVLVEEDTLLKLGIQSDLTDVERLANYTNNTTKKTSYITSKMLKKVDGKMEMFYSFDGKTYITAEEFKRDYTANYIKAIDKRKRGAVIANSIYSPIRAIPLFASNKITNSREGFYGNDFFVKAKKAIMSLKAGDALTQEYHAEMEFNYYNEYTKSVEKATYKNVVIFKSGEQIVGVQERIHYSDGRLSEKAIDDLITDYVKTGDNNTLTEIRNKLLEIENEIVNNSGEDNPYINENTNYNIEKVRMMRNTKPVMVNQVSNGTIILGEQQSISSLFNKLGVTSANWSYEISEDSKFPLRADIVVDGRTVPVYANAQSVDADYLSALQEQINMAKEFYEDLYNKGELKNNAKTKELRMLLEGEVEDFLYANRVALRKALPALYDVNGYVNYRLSKAVKNGNKETYAVLINNLNLAIALANNSMSDSLGGVYNKAVFMAGTKTAMNNNNIYLNNLNTKIVDVAIPVVNVSYDNTIAPAAPTAKNELKIKEEKIATKEIVEEAPKPKKNRFKNIVFKQQDTFNKEQDLPTAIEDATESSNENATERIRNEQINKNKDYITTQLNKNGSVKIGEHTITQEEYNNMTKEEQDNLIKCF